MKKHFPGIGSRGLRPARVGTMGPAFSFEMDPSPGRTERSLNIG